MSTTMTLTETDRHQRPSLPEPSGRDHAAFDGALARVDGYVPIPPGLIAKELAAVEGRIGKDLGRLEQDFGILDGNAQATKLRLIGAPGTSPSGTSGDAAAPGRPQGPSAARQTSANQKTVDIAAVLGRHQGLIKGKMDRASLEKLRDKADTPDDEKQALSELLDDPAQMSRFDSAKNGKTDGRISADDIRTVQDSLLARSEASQRSQAYVQNYVPSDASPDSRPRVMGENDAMRELFRYSQSLPKHIDMDTLRKIADGSEKMDKCPPQLAAAAQYFVGHPDAWKSFTKNDKDGKVSRDRMCDLASEQVKLSPQEMDALRTVQDNENVFFAHGGLTPDKLQKLAADDKQSPEVRQAAALLGQDNSMLFEMLDNGKHGAGGDAWNKSNDRNISKGDVSAFIKKGTDEVETPDIPSLDQGPDAMAAQADMRAGQQTAPDRKKEEGGWAKELLEGLLTGITAFVPGLDVVSLGAEAANVARVAITAGVKAGETAGKDAASTVVKNGVKEGVKENGKDQAQNQWSQYQQDQAPTASAGAPAEQV